MSHHELAKQFAVDLESRCVNLQLKQSAHWNQMYEPMSMKLRKFLHPESPQTDGVSVEWKKEYNNMRHPIDALRRQAIQQSEHAIGLSRHDPFDDDLLAKSSTNPSKPAPGWTNDWATLRVSCERLEAERSEFMKGMLTAYADALSAICTAQIEVGFLLMSINLLTVNVYHNQSCDNINLSLDLFKPQDVVDDFVQKFGGNETIVEDVDTQAAPVSSSLKPLRTAKEKITTSVTSPARVPLPTPSTRNELVRRSRGALLHFRLSMTKLNLTFSVKISTTTEEGAQSSFSNEGVTVINDHSSTSNSRLEKGRSLRVEGERQYPRSTPSQVGGAREPSAPVTTRLRPASFYSKINTFWRPTLTPQPQSSSTNTDSQRRGRPVLVGDLLVLS